MTDIAGGAIGRMRTGILRTCHSRLVKVGIERGVELERTFALVNERGQELTRLSVDVMFYFDYPLSEQRDRVLEVLDAFWKLCPKVAIRWYLTATMKQYEAATPRSYTLPAAWWKDGAPRRPLRELQLKDGESHTSVAARGLYLRSAERSNRSFSTMSNYLRFMVPSQLVQASADAFVAFVVSVCEKLPFVSGHGGYVIECNQYFPNQAQTAAFPLAMRFQAVDIATMSRGPWAVRGDRIKNVGWLTLVGAKLLAKIGGVEALERAGDERLSVIRTTNGAVMRAGKQPILGDVNRREDLSTYVAAYRAVQSLQEGIVPLFAPFDLADDVDAPEATECWLRRFAEHGR